jgi:hypothetical protein
VACHRFVSVVYSLASNGFSFIRLNQGGFELRLLAEDATENAIR